MLIKTYDGYYNKKIQDFIVTCGSIPAKFRGYDIFTNKLLALFENWLTSEIRVILVNREYVFDQTQINYNEVKKFELDFDGYKKGGKLLKNKQVWDNYLDADDIQWHGTFRNKGAIIYNHSKKNELIAYVDYMFEAEIVRGTLTIQWQDQGIISKGLLHG